MSDYLNQMLDRRYSRRGFIAAAGASAFVVACGGSQDAETEGGDTDAAAAGQLEGTLVYYNWVDYVNPETYKSFTADTKVDIRKDFYESNEELQAKLQGGARGFDLIVPTGYMVQILAEADLLQELDYEQLPNVEENIDAKFTGLPYDPEDRFSVPKDWGTTGFVYRTDLVKEKPTSWREFVDLTKGPYSRKVTILDGIPEVIGSIALMLGYSYNTEDEAELDQVKEELIELKPHLQAITSTTYKQSLIAGRTVMALGWNGDGAAVAAEQPAEYVVPDEGAEFWVDAYSIPIGAKNPTAAHAWINYCYEPEHNATETEYTYYGSPLRREVLAPVIDEKVLNDPDVFPPEEQVAKLVPNEVTAEGTKLRNRIWTEFKAA